MLAKECDEPSSFPGAVELAGLAKKRLLVRNGNASLADLCAVILKKNLAKNVAERASNMWNRPELTPAQLQYAATDAYVALELYNTIVSANIPQLLPAQPEIGCPVFIYADPLADPVAIGRIVEEESLSKNTQKGFKIPTITNLRTVVSVKRVFARGAIVGPYQPPRLLSDFGEPDFSIVCLRSHVRIASESLILSTPFDSPAVITLPHSATHGIDLTGGSSTAYEPNSDDISVQELLSKSSGTGRLISHKSIPKMAADSVGQQTAEDIIDEVSMTPPVYSRVCKDPYHVFAEIYISRMHSLGYTFSVAMRDAFFIPNPNDRAQITLCAQQLEPPQTFESLVASRPEWVWQRCKRTIPPPEELFKAVSEVFKTFGPLLDAASKKPLFNAQAWKTSKNILELIRKGHVSDPPGVSLYYPIRTDSNGLTIYRCARGTNFVEGGWHRHIKDKLPKSGVSIRHLTLSLKDYALGHNLRVSLNIPPRS